MKSVDNTDDGYIFTKKVTIHYGRSDTGRSIRINHPGENVRILFLQEQPCIRTLKYAKGLRSLEEEISLFFGYRGETLNGFYGHGDELFDEWFQIGDNNADSLRSIADHTAPDIIHCHNGPDTLTVDCIQVLGGSVPIIHDIHDLLSIRNTIYEDGLDRGELDRERILREEKTAIENCDGLITVSPAILDIVKELYELDSKRIRMFPNYVVGEMVPDVLGDKLSSSDGRIHIVYEGHLDQKRSGGHYDLIDIFRVISDLGITIHIYPSVENELYRNLGERSSLVHYHGSLQPRELMAELPRYDFGWAGFNTSRNSLHADTVLANKTFEYLAAGLPVISFPHKSQKDFIDSHGVGIIIDDVRELPGKLTSTVIDHIRRNVLEKRYSFTVEKGIRDILSLYRQIS